MQGGQSSQSVACVRDEYGPRGETTRPRPFEAPRYTVSMMSMSCRKSECCQPLFSCRARIRPELTSCLSSTAHEILLLLPVPRS